MPPAAARRPGDMSGSAPLEILVVDDDAHIRTELRRFLEDEGHRVVEAETGDRALEILGERRVDAVLLDIRMPGTDGLDALVQIRESAPDTGVVMVSGEATQNEAFRAGQRGAFDFIPKPVRDTQHLLDVIREALRGDLPGDTRDVLATLAAGRPARSGIVIL